MEGALLGPEPAWVLDGQTRQWERTIDDFASAFISSSDGTLDRDRLLQVVEKGPDDEKTREWMEAIAELDNSDDPTPGFIVDFLVNRHNCKPWTVCTDDIDRLRSVLSRSPRPGGIDPNKLIWKASKISAVPAQSEALTSFLKRDRDACHKISERYILFDSRKSIPGQDSNELSDLLGIAGYVPLHCLSQSRPNRSMLDVVQEYKSHIKVGDAGYGYRAQVSLEPLEDSPGENRASSEAQQIQQVLSLYGRLREVLERLCELGTTNDHLVFLRRRRAVSRSGPAPTASAAKSDNDDHEDDPLAGDSFIEASSVELVTVYQLVRSVERFENFLAQRRSSWWNGWKLWSAGPAIAAFFLAQLMNPLGVLLGGAMSLLWQWLSGDQRRDALLALSAEADPILQKLSWSMSLTQSTDGSEAATTLQQLAVTGQFLSLVLRSYVAHSMAPFDYGELLDGYILRFQLSGITPNAPPVFACAQELSCFPGGLFLVADPGGVSEQRPLSLRASPAELMTLLRPTALVVTSDQAPNAEAQKVVAMKVGGGWICPSSPSGAGDGSAEWHWEPYHRGDWEFVTEVLPSREVPVELHESISIGPCLGPSPPQQAPEATSAAASLGMSAPPNPTPASSSFTSTIAASSSTLSPNDTSSTGRSSPSSTPSDTAPRERRDLRPSPPRGDPEEEELIEEPLSRPTCPWNSDVEERTRLNSFFPGLIYPGTSPPGTEAIENQMNVGFSAPMGIATSGFRRTYHVKAGRPASVFIKKAQGAEIIRILNEYYCGLLISLHTGVAQRVALRFVVAEVLERRLADSGQSEEGGADREIVGLLRRDQRLDAWQAQQKGSMTWKLVNISKSILSYLESCELRKDKTLVVAWGPSRSLPISRRDNVWFGAMAESQNVSTWASVTSSCQETPECQCPKARAEPAEREGVKWTMPRTFRLRTKVRAWQRERWRRDGDREEEVKENKSYFLNDARLGMVGTILGSVPGEDGFYCSVKHIWLGSLARYLPCYDSLLEAPEGSRSLIIGSGREFRRQVEEYIRDNAA